MIPQRVKLKGFLCYKEEQSVEFGGNATLWMLSGLNGSGKSAIFDAVTWSLFGHHRGGGTNAQELINKDSDTLLVEFDFLLDTRPYRVKRTLKRDTRGGARGTQQVLRYEEGAEGKGGWVAVDGTGQRREFDAWVAENIGLTYDTFTSSVLLLQGKAEKLLDSKPEGRREVLASIVDLERYERLHQKADEQRKSREGALKTLNTQLALLQVVTDEQLEQAAAEIQSSEATREAARAEVSRLLDLRAYAGRWVELQHRLASARHRFTRAQQVLADAPAIERAVERLRELREVIPHLHEIALSRARVFESEQNTRRYEEEKKQAQERLAKCDSDVKAARARRATLSTEVTRQESELREVAARLQVSAALMERLRECERVEADLKQIEADLARLPGDVAGKVTKARAAFETLDVVGRLVPVLTRFSSSRQNLGRAREEAEQAQKALEQVRERGEKAKEEKERLGRELEEATRKTQLARDRATEAQTLLGQAKSSLSELSQLAGAKVCRHCGQALTEGHMEEEKRKRKAEVESATTRLQEAQAARKQAETEESTLRQMADKATKVLGTAREEYSALTTQAKHARSTVERLQDECARIYGELPPEYRQKVCSRPPSDWLSTTYPTPAELEELRGQAQGREAARQELTKAERLQQQHALLIDRQTQARENLARVSKDLPAGAGRDKLRQEHTALQSKQVGLHKGIDDAKRELSKVEREFDGACSARDRQQEEVTRLDGVLREQGLVRDSAQRAIAAHTRQLPASWHEMAARIGMTDLFQVQGERKRLEDDGTDDKARELAQAQMNLDVLRQEQINLEAQEAEFPAEAKLQPAEVDKLLEAARAEERSCDELLRGALGRKAHLDNARAQRQRVEEEARRVEAEVTSDRLLAELLGRDRLQLYLVRQAERQVVEYANAVLDRLSGGQLYLKLSGEANGEGTSAKALELEAYNRATGERPINVAFLSGSQKFRVAVSLALGIGQYASRQHRPIESVIIDEGFGCLDSQGRQVMVQELQNLRSQMRCILLVSHQEDFAEAFSDGYHFELCNGATRVQRIRK